MPTYYFQLTPGKTESVYADSIRDDEEAGVRHLMRRGEIVRTLPAGTPIRLIKVTEILHPRGDQLPVRR